MTIVGAPQSIDIAKDPPGLILTWPDGFKRKLSFAVLRKKCPCANCQGEATPLDPPPEALPVAASPALEAVICTDVFKIGGYAIGFAWGDGHDTGIYSWEYLRELAEREGEGTRG